MNKFDIDFKKLVPQFMEQYSANTTNLKLKQNTRILGLMGQARSGKDTVADYLIENYGYIKFAFGTKLKITANDLFGESTAKDRGLYQWFGQECRKIDSDIWIKLMVADINTHLSLFDEVEEVKFVITDIRQPNERLWAKDHGVKVIKIETPLEMRIDRIIERGDECTLKQLRDETERMLEVMTYDFLVENEGSLDDLKDQVNSIMDYRRLSLYA
ncbi:Dephospho-CoA kinase [Seinonella peptonophila]|uniref:Dephospho-CoA kinase n=1 Tax=Seinonella peptonophila TaxID=112248 RepID=A0A1M4VDM7_9BACL|nr:AAA family ATPase [Seinonella peptonophila]SHE67066.1 Dephospho-CoA kinase [Seinonella peptonophila]